MTRLTVIIMTYNEAEHIVDCIEAARNASDDVLVFDSYSTDETASLAEGAGARVRYHPFENYSRQRNAALDSVEGETGWVLFVDADERVTPELAAEVQQAIEQPGYAGWRIPRHNYIFGKLTRGAGWYPDYQLRLLRVGAAHYDPERRVHEYAELDGAEGTLSQHFVHYNYKGFDQFVAKQREYTAYDARILYEQGIRPKPQNYILQPLRHFWWRFVTLKGYRDGLHGLWLSLLMGWYELRKYWILRALWQQKTG